MSKPRKSLLGKTEPTTSKLNSGIVEGNAAEGGGPSENGISMDAAVTEEEGAKGSADAEEEAERKNEEAEEEEARKCYGFAGLPLGADKLDPVQLCTLRQHELFLSRIVESLPATQIRGKCAVVILNEVETCDMYLGQDVGAIFSVFGHIFLI